MKYHVLACTFLAVVCALLCCFVTIDSPIFPHANKIPFVLSGFWAIGGIAVVVAFSKQFTCFAFTSSACMVILPSVLPVIAIAVLFGYFDLESLWIAAVSNSPSTVCSFMNETNCVGWTSFCPSSSLFPPGLASSSTSDKCPFGCTSPQNSANALISCKDAVTLNLVSGTGWHRLWLLTAAGCTISFILFILNHVVENGGDSENGSLQYNEIPDYIPMNSKSGSSDNWRKDRCVCCSAAVKGILITLMLVCATAPIVCSLDLSGKSFPAITSVSFQTKPIETANSTACGVATFTLDVQGGPGNGVTTLWTFSDGTTTLLPFSTVMSLAHSFISNCTEMNVVVTLSTTATSDLLFALLNVSRYGVQPTVITTQTLANSWMLHSCSPSQLIFTPIAGNESVNCASFPSVGTSLVGQVPSAWYTASCSAVAPMMWLVSASVCQPSTYIVTVEPQSLQNVFAFANLHFGNLGASAEGGSSASSLSAGSSSQGSASWSGSETEPELREAETAGASDAVFSNVQVQNSLSIHDGVTGSVTVSATAFGGIAVRAVGSLSLNIPFSFHKSDTDLHFALGLAGVSSVTVDLDGSMDLNVDEKIKRKIASFSVTRWIIVGDIPIVFKPYVKVTAFASAKAQFGITVEESAQVSASGMIGLTYNSGSGVSKQDSWATDNSGTSTSVQPQCDAKLTIGVGVVVGVRIDALATVFVDVVSSVDVNAPATVAVPQCDTSDSSSGGSEQLSVSVSADAAVHVGGAVSLVDFNEQWTPYSGSKQIVSTCFSTGLTCNDVYRCDPTTWTCVKDTTNGHSSLSECSFICPTFVETYSHDADCGGAGSGTVNHRNKGCDQIQLYSEDVGSFNFEVVNANQYTFTIYSDNWCSVPDITTTYSFGVCVLWPTPSSFESWQNKYHSCATLAPPTILQRSM